MFSKKDVKWRLFLCPLYLLASSFYSSLALAGTDCASDSYDKISTVRYIHDGDTLHLGWSGEQANSFAASEVFTQVFQ